MTGSSVVPVSQVTPTNILESSPQPLFCGLSFFSPHADLLIISLVLRSSWLTP